MNRDGFKLGEVLVNIDVGSKHVVDDYVCDSWKDQGSILNSSEWILDGKVMIEMDYLELWTILDVGQVIQQVELSNGYIWVLVTYGILMDKYTIFDICTEQKQSWLFHESFDI
ncbi:Hypothetical protein MVR_LOCUS325 [uncultured virus]|nr:Hypothetical protein MVR_LOCUS325 [uncultured virus]